MLSVVIERGRKIAVAAFVAPPRSGSRGGSRVRLAVWTATGLAAVMGTLAPTAGSRAIPAQTDVSEAARTLLVESGMHRAAIPAQGTTKRTVADHEGRRG